ncbi:amino acid permease [candidate division WWE3 bacterium]|uniref:Amino acid permease n=1 Tax=candidate division WWE3 bacterium TaxID=2053526 RepID=A0A955LJP0_UNCKA|nr:amino acid permease [candidate division WWE3 bacterium]
MKRFWEAVFLLAGTTIGAGIFGIPYATAKVGYPIGLAWLIVLTIVVCVINVLYALSILNSRYKKPRQFVGYAQEYLGNTGRYVALFVILFGQWGALLAYIIGSGVFLSIIFTELGYAPLYSILFVVVGAFVTLRGLKLIAAIESWLTIGMVMIVVAIMAVGLPHLDVHNLAVAFGWGEAGLLMPYGVIFGALSGYAVIPELTQFAKGNGFTKKHLLAACIVGALIPAVIYGIFQMTVVGVSGALTSEDAITGLLRFLDPGIITVGAILGTLAMFSSFITLTRVIKDTFEYDFKMPALRAWYLAIVPPVLIFVAGVTSFIRVLEFMGVWLGTSSGLLIVVMYIKSRKKPKRRRSRKSKQ